MPQFLEQKLKNEYGTHSATPFKVMNAMGAMHGNQITPMGKEMEAKHVRDLVQQKLRTGKQPVAPLR